MPLEVRIQNKAVASKVDKMKRNRQREWKWKEDVTDAVSAHYREENKTTR